ncbi:hypothetical protein NUSPORA_00390 [Nucleospora cyclopteri]
MLQKQDVPTFYSKKFIKKFSSPENYLSSPNLIKKHHLPQYKSVLCKFFVNNLCTKGNNCEFSHKISDFTDEQILLALNPTNVQLKEADSKRTPSFVSPF